MSYQSMSGHHKATTAAMGNGALRFTMGMAQ